MFKVIYKCFIPLTVATACLGSTVASANAATVSDYARKAEFIYNFSKFTQWPEQTGELKICIYGRDPFGNAFDNLNKKINNKRTIKVIRTQSIDKAEKCHIAFINNVPEEKRYYKRVMRRLNRSGVLTIANDDKARAFEVMIGLTNNKNITFKANKTIVNNSSIRISSKLLRLAKE